MPLQGGTVQVVVVVQNPRLRGSRRQTAAGTAAAYHKSILYAYYRSVVKNGTRLQSQVCETQVIVVRSGDGADDLRCGGQPMLPIGDAESQDTVIDPRFATGTVMGKRYVDEAGIEVLVTKAGIGTLSVGEVPLQIKESKPLPASD